MKRAVRVFIVCLVVEVIMSFGVLMVPAAPSMNDLGVSRCRFEGLCDDAQRAHGYLKQAVNATEVRTDA